MSVAEPLTVGVHNCSYLQCHKEEENEDHSLLEKLHKMAITENTSTDCDTNGTASENESDEELIERGPTISKRRQRVTPYPPNSDSPSSCSDSSQGSPSNVGHYSSGGSLVVNVSSSHENFNREESIHSPDSVPNRHTYMHKNGGQVHLVNQNISSASSELFNASFKSRCFTDTLNSECLELKALEKHPSLNNMSQPQYLNGSRYVEISLKDESALSDTSLNSPSSFSESSYASSDYTSTSSPDMLRNEAVFYKMENVSIDRQGLKTNEDYEDKMCYNHCNFYISSKIEQESNNMHSNLISNNDMPEELKDFIVNKTNYKTSGNLRSEEYAEAIEDIMKDMVVADTSSVHSLQETNHHLEYSLKPVTNNKISHSHVISNINHSSEQSKIKNKCVPDVLIPSTVEQVQKSPPFREKINSSSPMKSPISSPSHNNLIAANNSTIILSTPTCYNTIIILNQNGLSSGYDKNIQKKLPAIAPKPEPSKFITTHKSSNSDDLKLTESCISKEQDSLRDFILNKFSDDEKRYHHCTVTKIPDEQITQQYEDGDTLLHISLCKSVLSSVYLIDRFSELSSLNIVNLAGETPLLVAITNQQYDLIKYLLDQGANPNSRILKNGCTVLHYTAQKGLNYLEVVKLLCQHPSTKIDIFNNEGKTPLMLAFESHGKETTINSQITTIDSEMTIKLLLKYKASVFAKDRKSGKTVFHVAVEKKNPKLLMVICSESQDIEEAINVTMFDGNTPLHLICAMNNCDTKLRVEFIKLMLKNGASTKMENVQKKFPCDLVDRKYKEIRKLLL